MKVHPITLIFCAILLAIPAGLLGLLLYVHLTRYWTLCLLSQTIPGIVLGLSLLRSKFRSRFKALVESSGQPNRKGETWGDLSSADRVFSLLTFPGIILGLVPLILIFSGLFKWDKSKIFQHMTGISLLWFTYSVTVAYLFASHSQIRVSLALCAYMAATSVHATLSGFGIRNGVMRLLNYPEGSLPPMSILAHAFSVAGAFGCLHFNLWMLDSSAYHGLRDWQDSLYFSVVTLATVGYGDITPLSHLARWASMIEIIVGFVILVMAFSATMSVWLQRGQSQVAERSGAANALGSVISQEDHPAAVQRRGNPKP